MAQPNKMLFITVPIDNVVYSTEKAVLIEKDGEQCWIPRSALSLRSDKMIPERQKNLDIEAIDIHDWLAKEKGFD